LNTALPPWRRKFARLAGLEARDWRYLALALLHLPRVSRALGDRGLAAFPELFTPARELPSPAQLAVARRIAGMVDLAAARGPWRATCLVRSLVLARFLRARGIPCQLEMGSRLDGDGDARFSAHAWVRCGDAVLNDGVANTRRYQAFQRREP
jgi:hypothetical protein